MSTNHRTRRPAPSRLQVAIVAALVGLTSLGVLVTSNQKSAEAKAATLSGVFPGSGDTAKLRAFETWRGRKATVVADYVDGDSWATMEDPSWGAAQWASKKVAWGLPMLPKTGGTLATGAKGTYNVHFSRLAKNLVDAGHGSDIVRIGWEMNGDWFSWSALKDPASFISYWRQIVKSMRAVPGADFKFVWAPGVGKGSYAPAFTPDDAYPGDGYVDVVGTSIYDQSWAVGPSATAERWDRLTNGDYGLNWQAKFAAGHSKPFALSEWGLSRRCDGNGGGDSSDFINRMAKWISSNNVYYETYFNYNSSSCEVHNLSAFPKASAAYRKAFSAPMVSGSATTTRTSATDVDLRVSWYSSLKNAKPLPWTGLNYNVWIYLEPKVAAKSVAYYFDDPQRTKTPMTQATAAPFDLLGNRKGFNASKMTPGRHTITALVTFTNGTTKVLNAKVTR